MSITFQPVAIPADALSIPAPVTASQIALDLGAIRKLLRQPLESDIAHGNLTGPQRTVMQVVVRQDLREIGISLKDLSKAVGLAQSTVSGIVDRLERAHLLERRPDPSDGRAVRIFPTPPVLEFLSDQRPHLLNDPLQQALAKASVHEIGVIRQALAHLRQLLESL